MEEATAIRVRNQSVRPAREQSRVPWGPRRTRRPVCAEQLGMEAPPHASRVGEPRLVVGGDPFGHPTRLIFVWEQPWGAPEHVLQPAPQPARAVEVKHVRELMRGHEPEPAIEEQQAVVAGRRRGVDGDPVGGKHRREAVRRVDIVGQRDVHDATRRVQLRREQSVGPLRLARLREGGIAVGGAEVDAEVGSVEGTPVARRIDLSLGAAGEQQEQQNAECGMRNAELQGRFDPRARPSTDIPHSAFPIPHCHGSRARSRRNASMPRTTARAYRHWPSSLASSASCSGSMMNRPSVSAAGIQVGRTSA